MSLTPLDPHTVRAAAQAALDERLGLIDAIVAAQNDRTFAGAKVAEAQAVERTAAGAELAAIRAAIDGGWSSAELRAAGIKVPHSAARKPSGAASSTKSAPRTPRPRPAVPGAARTDTGSVDESDPVDPAGSEDLANAS